MEYAATKSFASVPPSVDYPNSGLYLAAARGYVQIVQSALRKFGIHPTLLAQILHGVADKKLFPKVWDAVKVAVLQATLQVVAEAGVEAGNYVVQAINSRDAWSRTPLHKAAINGLYDLALGLAAAGASLWVAMKVRSWHVLCRRLETTWPSRRLTLRVLLR